MKLRKYFILQLLLCLPALVFSQTEDTENPQYLPVTLMLDQARSGGVIFRPDWPLDAAPDMFMLNTNNYRSININIDDTLTLLFSKDKNKNTLEFPFYDKNTFFQIAVNYGNVEKVNSIIGLSAKRVELIESNTIDESGPVNESETDNFEIEFLEYRQINDSTDNYFAPTLARVKNGEVYYFISFNYLNNLTIETWHDTEGNALFVYQIKYRERQKEDSNKHGKRLLEVIQNDGGENKIETYQYDSAGNITEIENESGIYTALYKDNIPYYITNNGHLTLQWDNNAALISVIGEAANVKIDSGFEYMFDKSKNWIERNEYIYSDTFKVYTLNSGKIIKREIKY